MTRVLILGAGVAGQQSADAMRAHPEYGAEALGYIDDDPHKQGTQIGGLEVLGTSADIPRLAAELEVDEVLIAMPSETGVTIRRLVRACENAGVDFKIVPGIREIILGDVRIEQIRRVEPEDLLGRESVEFDGDSGADYLAGRTVLVTGAGGTIGGEICRQVVAAGAARLLLLGRGENSVFEIEHEMLARAGGCELVPLIADVRERHHLERLLGEFRPQIVFHAAAHKHVHYMERFPEEAVLRNVVGTRNLLGAATAAGSERFVLVSTDKAAEPRSVMGATKRLAEDLVRESPDGGPRAVAVRFGNVLGSRGSVVPLFKRQIARGGPVTVSDPEVTRYFMTVREAASLVIRAGAMGQGGEIFILDMGQPIRILDLAHELIISSGYRPEQDIPIVITGLRPGEKLHERLWSEGEEVRATADDKILELAGGRQAAPLAGEALAQLIGDLERAAESCDRARVLELLGEAVTDFRPDGS
jgi:FlaA1/EpsC-like NDP-sugar epimerase